MARPVYLDEFGVYPFELKLRKYTDAIQLDQDQQPAVSLAYMDVPVRTLEALLAEKKIDHRALLGVLDGLTAIQDLQEVPPVSFQDVEMAEYIIHDDACWDTWTCICGNQAEDAGFYPCDRWGDAMEPTVGSGWLETYRCERCGRIIDQITHQVVGINNSPKGLEDEQ